MDKRAVSVSSFECEVLRSAFKKSVIEEKILEAALAGTRRAFDPHL